MLIISQQAQESTSCYIHNHCHVCILKMVRMVVVGAPISLDGWQSIRIVGASACVIFILHQKIQKIAKCTFWWLTGLSRTKSRETENGCSSSSSSSSFKLLLQLQPFYGLLNFVPDYPGEPVPER